MNTCFMWGVVWPVMCSLLWVSMYCCARIGGCGTGDLCMGKMVEEGVDGGG